MNEHLTTNDEAISIIKESEGFKAVAYYCPANVLSIGYGHTKGVRPGDRMTQEMALLTLKNDLREAEDGVKLWVKVYLNSNQFSALVSFVYNVGIGQLATSTLLKKINVEDFKGASEEFSRWTHGGGKILPGLVKRREKEKQLFIKNI